MRRTLIQYNIFVGRCRLFTYNLLVRHPKPFLYRSFPYQQPCCECSEPTSTEGAASEGVGSGIPTRIRGDRIAGQFLAAGENLALRKLRFSLRPSTALLLDTVFGYKVDI